MHYTIEKTTRIDAKIKKDQDYINFRVLDLLGNDVHSIILCGGFGRGEGTVLIQDDKIHIVNDYDITIVLKEHNPIKYAWLYKRYYDQLQALTSQLAKELQMKQIDISLKSISYFKNHNSLTSVR